MNKFSGFTISERAGRQTLWIWQHGFDIQFCDSPLTRKWNMDKHLFKEHRLADESGKRSPAMEKGWKDKTPFRNVAEMLSLNTHDPKEQAIANALIRCFNRDHFQKLLLEWVVDANISFRQPEHSRLRRIFEYLNPFVAVTNAHISHNIVRKRIVDLHCRLKAQIIDHLRNIPGKTHIAFDGWRSRNQHAVYGIVCFYLDHDGAPSKLVLGLPELKISHPGENIAAQVLEILESYEILDKIGTDAFEADVDGESGLNAAQHEGWRNKGPIGKLHNLVHWIHRSDKLTYRLRALQEEFFQSSTSTENRARKPLDVVLDNHTRWLSTLYMIRRGLKLRPFLEDIVAQSSSALMVSVLVDFEEALRMLDGGRPKADAERRSYRGVRQYVGRGLHVRIPNGKLDETPVYYAAAILNPVSRWGYFENTWTDTAQRPWLQEAKRTVWKRWEEEYKSLSTREVGDEGPPFKLLKAMSALERRRALRTSTLPCGTCPGKSPLDAELDEYDQWLLRPDLQHDPLVSDPVQYW
ncbi:restless-like transposase [Beauveria bassiana ARSEF 2860]|uniref:Restless-like transposase n=1 Tax=Beauveria bassiana (strain ARSEF 2860) TaxID=655819 RepID=J4KLD3_BEAB2|nr:restless-like transposase [Beauveria bassiana ARSEF 2860]EJP62004.1 restless-like transposase [Beauveria bassiana ARSEF 2860]